MKKEKVNCGKRDLKQIKLMKKFSILAVYLLNWNRTLFFMAFQLL